MTVLPAGGPPAGPSIVAHRGAMTERPENTMAAFRRAVDLGADILEVDVRTSSDGRLFVLHDAMLDRTTNGTGEASGIEFAALQAFDAGRWFDPSYAGERIPDLGSVLALSHEGVDILLDLKETGWEYAMRVSADILRFADPDRVTIGVRSVEQAREFRRLLPECRQLGFIPNPDSIEPFAEAGVDIIRLWLRWLDDRSELSRRVRDTGKQLMINGRHGDPEETERILEHRPDWILVDDVARLRRSLESLQVPD